MRTTLIVGAACCTLLIAACNDVARTSNKADAARQTAALDSSSMPSDTLPEAVPVPPASSSPVIRGEVEAHDLETPVAWATSVVSAPQEPAAAEGVTAAADTSAASDAAAKSGASVPSTPAAPSETPASAQLATGAQSENSASPEPKAGSDSSVANPAGTSRGEVQSNAVPMAAQGNESLAAQGSSTRSPSALEPNTQGSQN